MRDLLSDLSNYAWPSKWRYTSETINDVIASCGIISPQLAVNSMAKRSFRWRFMQNIFYFHINLFVLVFKHDFIRCVDFTRIAASSTASDDVTK